MEGRYTTTERENGSDGKFLMLEAAKGALNGKNLLHCMPLKNG